MIERLYVHNFRCLENFTLNLVDRPTALLIGRNGVGKSTVLYSFHLFQMICRGSNRAKNLISASDFARHDTERPVRLEVELTLGKKRIKYTIPFEWPPNFLRSSHLG